MSRRSSMKATMRESGERGGVAVVSLVVVGS
jgi:hypothetical protein